MPAVATADGTEIFYKDWAGSAHCVSHGWPLSADDWDPQLMFFVNHGFGSSPTTGAATAARARPPMVTTWITMRMTSRR